MTCLRIPMWLLYGKHIHTTFYHKEVKGTIKANEHYATTSTGISLAETTSITIIASLNYQNSFRRSNLNE